MVPPPPNRFLCNSLKRQRIFTEKIRGFYPCNLWLDIFQWQRTVALADQTR